MSVDREIVIDQVLPNFSTRARNRLPIFREIAQRRSEEPSTSESPEARCTPPNPSPTPKHSRQISRAVEIRAHPQLLVALRSEIAQLFSLHATSLEPSRLVYQFNDVRNAIQFINQGQLTFASAEFNYIPMPEEIIGVKYRESEELVRVMRKVGEVMRVRRVDERMVLIWYYEHEAYAKAVKLLEMFALKRCLKIEHKLRRRAVRPRRIEPLEINNAELYGGIKKRNSTNKEKEVFIVSLHEVIAGTDTRTTIMIKNIPNKYNQKMLLKTINENHRNTYDFFYLPIDFKNRCNVGYAFINFKHPCFIADFYLEFNGKKWRKFNSEKICSITYGRVQGLKALIEHFKTSSVMVQTDSRLKPLIFDN
eukprot:TRINITY_DN3886_c0_g1_i5.p1 TRINITY_DN3886_c0_g1~~TRINITY_DN3886_c0_g1_i5.p1  ORF type:complete len:365 (+),score=88.07 TRINITY_DN3886_c0_g1_i5:779-1873(+)